MIQPLAFLLAAAVHGDTPARPASSTFPSFVRPVVIHADTSGRITAMHRDADQLVVAGKFGEARTKYLTVIAYLDSTQSFPGEVLWALASMEYGRKREMRAAEILDQLADAAVRYGRPEWQATALLEAGLIYQTHGRTDLSVKRAQVLVPLLASPAIAPGMRALLAERVRMK